MESLHESPFTCENIMGLMYAKLQTDISKVASAAAVDALNPIWSYSCSCVGNSKMPSQDINWLHFRTGDKTNEFPNFHANQMMHTFSFTICNAQIFGLEEIMKPHLSNRCFSI